MIYGFLSDEAMQLKPYPPIKHDDVNVGVGYLSDDMVNYFATPEALYDKRSQRLLVQGAAFVAIGDMVLSYDRDRVEALNPSIWTDATSETYEQLFNIIEAAALAQYDLDADLDTLFITQPSVYGIYESGTLQRSMTYTNAQISMYSGNAGNLLVRHWVQFGIKITPTSETLMFKIWLGGEEFMTDYPYTTITVVVPPCEPSKLVDPNFQNIVDTLSRSAIYMNAIIGDEMKKKDHNGMKSYQTAYNSSQYVTRYEFPFGLMYKGPEPSSQVARIAVRNYLLELKKEDDTLLASEATWRSLFPELFIQAQFFIIPQWEDTFEVNNETYERSITSVKSTLNKLLEIFTWLEEVHVREYAEMIFTKASLLLLSTVPHPDNETIMSLNSEHFTFMAIDSTNQFFDVMQDHTKDFNSKLNACISALKGAPNTYTFLTTTIEGREYLSFTSNFIEYHVLKPAYY